MVISKHFPSKDSVHHPIETSILTHGCSVPGYGGALFFFRSLGLCRARHLQLPKKPWISIQIGNPFDFHQQWYLDVPLEVRING